MRSCNQQDGLPLGWYDYIHPEGAKYFYNPALRLITPSDILKQDIWEFIVEAFRNMVESIKEKGRELPLSTEVYLELQSDASHGECRYYLIDHNTRVVYWAEDISTEKLGLEAVASPEHMSALMPFYYLIPNSSSRIIESLLTPEYWLHVEHFPMHNIYPLGAEEELMAVLGHDIVDDKTAPTSTTPYSAEECKQFLRALEVMKHNMNSTQHDGYRLCTVARLWLMIARTRHVNAYGLKAPRLDRLQSLGPTDIGEGSSRVLEALSNTVLLGTPRATLKRLRVLWHGRIVYQRHWQAFFYDIRREWIQSGVLSLGIWIASVGAIRLTIAQGASRDLATASCGFSVTGTLLSSALYKLHSEDQLSGAYAITEYLIRVESYEYGLQPLSIMLSLPYAFSLWAIFTFAIAMALAVLEEMGNLSPGAVVVAAFCGGFPLLLLTNATAFFSGQLGPIGAGVEGFVWIGRCLARVLRQLLARRIGQDRF
ncbi:hypothetical protein FRC02_005101 [Tulasnella sp. 418]|nr:hypothetical protein FRC02_005101 [Tulasnella sp. 418]